MVSCYDSFGTLSPDEQPLQSPNSTISQIHTIYSQGTREVNQDIIVEGRVTANDEFGNFFKTFVIESDGYAIEILDGLYNSYVRHPLGSSIILKLNGMGLDRYKGVLRCGLLAPATSSYSLDYIEAEALVDQHISLTALQGAPTPQLRTIAQLEEARAGELITINSLMLNTEDGIERNWSGYALFQDMAQDSIWCYTSSYADFASEKIPQGELSLTGILEFGSTDSLTDQFIIKLRGSNDCTIY